jgi:hypothetical protein
LTPHRIAIQKRLTASNRAKRQLYRDRQRAGRVVPGVEVSETDVAAMLERAELLPEQAEHSPGFECLQNRTYQMRMPVRLLRQIFSALLVVAYLSSTIVAVAPAAKAAPAMASEASTTMMPMDHGMDGVMPMPCKSMKPVGCVTDAGCIFMVSLLAPHLYPGTPLAWDFVKFPMVTESVPSHSIKPLLGPPIVRA